MALIKAVIALVLQLSKLLVAFEYIFKLLAYVWVLFMRLFRRSLLAGGFAVLRPFAR